MWVVEDAEPAREHRWRRPLALIGGAALVLLVAGVLVLGFTPVLDGDLESRPAPATDHAQAMALAADLKAADGPEVNPLCGTQVLDHGERTQRSVVLLHGYTNCPQQFSVMARAYYDAGYNVVLARIPEHGMDDRMTRALSGLDPEGLTSFADSTVDIAAGLGDRVSVVGLSAGGTLAAWLAAERDDVAEVALLAPLMVPKVLPEMTVGPVSRLGGVLPDFYLWWDGKLKEQLATPPYAYPRYSVHSLGSLLAVGRRAQGRVDRSTPLERLLVVTNDNDGAVKNAAVARVADHLGDHATERVDHVFPKDLGYKHDIVDPQGENAADLEAIYDTLGPLLGIPELTDALEASLGNG
jgi:pimeloyl-ACP methyl ester carboxylesterase